MAQDVLFDQPVTMAVVDAFLKKLHDCEDEETNLLTQLAAAREETKDARKDLRKLAARVHVEALRSGYGAVEERVKEFQRDMTDAGATVTFTADNLSTLRRRKRGV